MLFNYHTHTKLCGHATGETREYVEKAIQAGLKTLGFSDHAPYPFPIQNETAYEKAKQHLFSYANEVRALAKEYEKDIRILCGFEVEYFPSLHQQEKAFLNQVQPDYLILGQHFIGDENNGNHVYKSEQNGVLTAYVAQAIEGLSTGDFLYLAHPDMVGWNSDADKAQGEYRRLCALAKQKNIPLELNLLGLRGKRCYPSLAFFKIAAEVGNDVVLGVDAHSPDAFLHTESVQTALQWVQELGLHLIEKPFL